LPPGVPLSLEVPCQSLVGTLTPLQRAQRGLAAMNSLVASLG
jgi:hypothetical protein